MKEKHFRHPEMRYYSETAASEFFRRPSSFFDNPTHTCMLVCVGLCIRPTLCVPEFKRFFSIADDSDISTSIRLDANKGGTFRSVVGERPSMCLLCLFSLSIRRPLNNQQTSMDWNYVSNSRFSNSQGRSARDDSRRARLGPYQARIKTGFRIS